MSVQFFALALAASLEFLVWGPPVLPPDTSAPTDKTDAPADAAPPSTDAPPATDAPPPTDAPPTDAPGTEATPPTLPDAPPDSTSLPPGLDPVPFPLDDQRRTSQPTPLDGVDPSLLPPQSTSTRRSIVDLRDPFDRPPARPRPTGETDGVRLLMPDLKDPFAPGLQRVRSQRLDMYVPNDIRDPFRDRPRTGLPPCIRTMEDGTVVQRPGQPRPESQCERSVIDLRDPFQRDQ